MGTYEIVAVLRADLDEEALGAALGAINQRITDNGGTVTGLDRWGKRKLAYPIKKHRDGFYALIVFGLDAARIPALRQTLGLQEDVLRLTVSKHYPKPEPAAAAHAPAGVAATAHGAAATTQSAGATTIQGAAATTQGAAVTTPGGATTTPGAGATTPGAAVTTPGAAATTPGAAATTPVTPVPASSSEGTPAPDGDPSHV